MHLSKKISNRNNTPWLNTKRKQLIHKKNVSYIEKQERVGKLMNGPHTEFTSQPTM